MKSYLQKHNNIKYSDHYATPEDIYNQYVINKEYFDPCPLNSHNFLFKFIPKNMFVNPPYSDIDRWVCWVIENHKLFNTFHTVLLIPSRTDTKYFHKLLEYGVDLEFIKGRLKFNGMKTGAPFPSVLVHLQSK